MQRQQRMDFGERRLARARGVEHVECPIAPPSSRTRGLGRVAPRLRHASHVGGAAHSGQRVEPVDEAEIPRASLKIGHSGDAAKQVDQTREGCMAPKGWRQRDRRPAPSCPGSSRASTSLCNQIGLPIVFGRSCKNSSKFCKAKPHGAAWMAGTSPAMTERAPPLPRLIDALGERASLAALILLRRLRCTLPNRALRSPRAPPRSGRN